MAQKILGIDLGTNSIGLSLRNLDNGGNLFQQLDYFSSLVYKSGVGHSKSGEYSYAADRTTHRSTRRNYQVRKYRIWATLQLLIDYQMCPLSQEDLDRWSCYDKEKGLKRQYPVDAAEFEQWVRLDFDGDGVADYSSPYQLRAELMERQFDFSQQIERYKLGRAIYHIAQRRGFKSSKGETMKEQEKNDKKVEIVVTDEEVNMVDVLKKSEEKKSKAIKAYMDDHQLLTVGCAMASLEREGIRVRNSEYTAVRSQYKKEIEEIFKKQDGLDINSKLYRRLTSEKKGEGTIFYKRPLRSQKGNVGKCTLEPKKPRCPISHPDFEDFRAWSFINNIKYRRSKEDDWTALTLEQKEKLYKDVFLLTRKSFKFEEIRKWMVKELLMKLDYEQMTINYKDRTNVSGCPISGRLKNLMGSDWRNEVIHIQRANKQGESYSVKYNYEDLWHICFSYEEGDAVLSFAQDVLGWEEKKALALQRMYGDIQQGYGMLSLKAIRNINRFLHKGFIYTDATLLAKIPDIIGEEKWNEIEPQLMGQLNGIIEQNKAQRQLYSIANNLIALQKSLSVEDKAQYYFTDYILTEDDVQDVKSAIHDAISDNKWKEMSDEEQANLVEQITNLYQQYFASSKRDYYKVPKVGDDIQAFVSQYIGSSDKYKWNKMYHPSVIQYYAPVKAQNEEVEGRIMSLRYLQNPTLGGIKNPVALRTLQILRRQLNSMLKQGMIDEDTRIVVETARDLKDANMRWAIEEYQRKREAENKEIISILEGLNRVPTDIDMEKVRIWMEQEEILDLQNNVETTPIKNRNAKQKAEVFKKDLTKYKLWKEQKCRCIYTGKIIQLSELFADSAWDIEHTIPRSISYDDSFQNLTICDADFNRKIKRNRMPSELDNYDAVLARIQPWIEKVEHLKDQVAFWREQSKRATDIDRKNTCIRQRHLWEMELDYWQSKVERFTKKKEDLTLGFRNRQLIDTSIITKYAFHYLKASFNKVEVEKGGVTAAFRKILGVQSADEKKDRGHHSHHAIDATMLTVIPVAAKRDKMLQLFYEIEEAEKLHEECSGKKFELQQMIKSCHIGKIDNLAADIDANILINHISKDQTLTPAHRRMRVRGKVVKNAQGDDIWLQGDSIRASLHQDTYYGAICYPKTRDGKPIKEDGKWVYDMDNEGNPIISMVVNKPIDGITEKDIDSIVNPATREAVRVELEKRAKGISPQNSPIYMLDSDGNPITHDKHGKPISPIRHIRCRAKAGRGYLQYNTAIKLKGQTYLSDAKYKQSYYVQNSDNYVCLLYEGVHKGKLKREFKILNYFDIVSCGYHSLSELKCDFRVNPDNEKLLLRAAIIAGTRVLLWEKEQEELMDLDRDVLQTRLYVVEKFNNTGSDHVYLRHHLEARDEADIPKDEKNTIFQNSQKSALLMLTANNLTCMIENVDFKINDIGGIIWL